MATRPEEMGGELPPFPRERHVDWDTDAFIPSAEFPASQAFDENVCALRLLELQGFPAQHETPQQFLERYWAARHLVRSGEPLPFDPEEAVQEALKAERASFEAELTEWATTREQLWPRYVAWRENTPPSARLPFDEWLEYNA